jgi:dienelactone hydrolase
MAHTHITTPDPLKDFTRRPVTYGAWTRELLVSGDGPGVIIVHEVPGITPEVARFARFVRDAGFAVYLPSLLGEPGKPLSGGYLAKSALRACIAREFKVLAANESSPIVDWLRALARDVHATHGGPGVGALGMCLTGNFALSMMIEPSVVAPVLCQPSLPIVALGGAPAGLHASAEDVAIVRARMERENLTLRGYRFEGDTMCRGEKFAALTKTFGPRFEGRVLPDSAAKKGTPVPTPHSVVTTHLVDEAGSPTRAAVDEVIAFFQARLASAAGR